MKSVRPFTVGPVGLELGELNPVLTRCVVAMGPSFPSTSIALSIIDIDRQSDACKKKTTSWRRLRLSYEKHHSKKTQKKSLSEKRE